MCCSSCIIFYAFSSTPLSPAVFILIIISIIMNCASIAFAQRVVQRCQRPPLCSTLSLTVCHCVSILCIFVPLCFNSVHFCATVFEICVFLYLFQICISSMSLCFRFVLFYLCVSDLMYFVTLVFQIWFQQSIFTSNPALSFPNDIPPQKKKKNQHWNVFQSHRLK